jgi:hypothetical protein
VPRSPKSAPRRSCPHRPSAWHPRLIKQTPAVAAPGMPTRGRRSATSTEVLSAPEDQDLIITDLVLDAGTNGTSCIEHWRIDFTIPGATLASTSVSPRFRREGGYNYSNDNNYGQGSHLSLRSGLRVPAGTVAQLEAISMQHSGCSSRTGQILWTASGYYAQP